MDEQETRRLHSLVQICIDGNALGQLPAILDLYLHGKAEAAAATTAPHDKVVASELEDAIRKVRNNEFELKIELGKDRYTVMRQEILDLIKSNGLPELQAEHLLTHLADIFRLERIRV